MKIAENRVVKMHYSVMDKDGNAIDSSFDDEPLELIIGTGFLIPGLESALIDKQVGDTFTVEVPAADGYGERNDNLMQAVPKTMFEGMDISPGMQFRATTDDGDQTVIILEILDEEVVVDGNHPLSGIDLTFDVEILAVREATEEELTHGHVHSAGGCCGSSDSEHEHSEQSSCCEPSDSADENGCCPSSK